MVWSHDGRSHPQTHETLKNLAEEIARLRGGTPGEILQRITTEVGTQLALRKSRMAQRCFPPLDRAGWMARYGTAPVADDPGNPEEQDPWGGDADAHWEPTGGNWTAPWDGLDPSPGRRS